MKTKKTENAENEIVTGNPANAEIRSLARSGATIIAFGIACCGVAVAIVLLVGIASIL
jgi:hypothetical protein